MVIRIANDSRFLGGGDQYGVGGWCSWAQGVGVQDVDSRLYLRRSRVGSELIELHQKGIRGRHSVNP